MRIIPGKTKVSLELFKGISLADFIIGLVFLGLIVLALVSSLPGKLVIALVLLFLAAALLVRVGDEPNYLFFLAIIRHLSYRKNYAKGDKPEQNDDVGAITSFTDIRDDMIIYGDEYFGAVLEIPPVEFRFFSEIRRSVSVDECLGGALRNLHDGYSANIIKLERRVPYDAYIRNEQEKLDELRRVYENGLMTEEEYKARCEIVFDRISELESLNSDNPIVAPYYYIALFDSDRNQLRLQLSATLSMLRRGELQAHRLNTKELALFLKYNSSLDFDETELDELQPEQYARWAMPEKVQIQSNRAVVNDIVTYTMAVNGYPLRVGDAWLAGVMSVPATKVVVKCKPMDRSKTVRNIDRSIAELRARYAATGVDSTRLEIGSHIESLNELLVLLQGDSEVILDTDIYVTCYDISQTAKETKLNPPEKSSLANIGSLRRTVRRIYREAELRLSGLQFRQLEGYIGAQISGYDPLAKTIGRGIPGRTVAGMYPWIYAHVNDEKGIKLGSEDGIPVFMDMFRRDSERVNSNVVIVGKSGSGKSYAAKSILANLAADDSKIFVLDPENEYAELAANLHGKFINVGNAMQGRMNPFHIITGLDDDVEEVGAGSYASHLQFLEEFFRQILPDCDKDALEYLNALVDRVYTQRGITAETNLSLLGPEDYPTFDDLYDAILAEFQHNDNSYIHAMLRTLMNYISKFATGGRNANIWNGPSTITTDENFTVFNFQSLLANGNSTVTNAQMLLVLKYIDNEIIKNRDFNLRYHLNRKIVVVIDEAHVFIDEKYPIALDFMFQLAKRIRKYNGMQIVITQNIKDFVGTEEISRKSSAIINACQYSFIFPMAPYDLQDLCRLYEKAGGINENEQEKIVTAPRGNAFVVLGPSSRSSFQVEVPENVVTMFSEADAPSRYFNGAEGADVWENYLGDSRAKHAEAAQIHETERIREEETRASHVLLTEVTEEEYEQELLEKAPAIPFFTEESLPAPETGTADPERMQAAQENAFVAPSPVTPAAAAPQPIVIRESSAGTEELANMVSEMRRMMEVMGKFSYESILNDVLNRIQSETGIAPTAGKQPAAAPAAEPEPLADLFADLGAEEAEPVSAPDFDDDIGDFDILSLLAQAAEQLDRTTALEEMEANGETVRTITLEELVLLTKKK